MSGFQPTPTRKLSQTTHPVTAYVRSISRFPILSREAEHELAVAWRERRDHGARAKLVNANLRLVVAIARKVHGRPMMDYIQEGNQGLLEAVDKFDPHCGTRLTTYAHLLVRSRMLEFLLRNRQLVRIGTTQNQAKIFFNYKRACRALRAWGQTPTPENLAAEIGGVSPAEVAEMQSRIIADRSLDVTLVQVSSDGPSNETETAKDTLPANEPLLDDQAESRNLQNAILAFADSLLGRERELFLERLATDEPADLTVFGKRWSVSRQRVSEIQTKLTARFREYLTTRGYLCPTPETRWTQARLLQHIATGLPCPPRLEPTARRLKAAGLIYRPRAGAWAVTDAGRAHLGRTT